MLVPSASFHADTCTALLHRSPNSMKAFAAALLVAATLTPSLVMAQTPPLTIETSSPYQEVLRRGNTLTLKHKFSVNGAISTDYWFFMHVVDFNNVIRLQDDHPPPSPTSSWLDVNATPKPDVAWTRSLVIPSTFPFGDYKVVAGLYNRNAPGTPRLVLTPGNYVQELSAGSSSYVVAYLTVTNRDIKNATFTCKDIYLPEADWEDKTSALNSDLATIATGTPSAFGQLYKLPRGGCKYSSNLIVPPKTNIDIVGPGVMDTTLLATNKAQSALKVTSGNKVRVRDFSLRTSPAPDFYPCTDTQNRILQRSTDPLATGILIDGGSDITILRTRIGPVFNSGIYFGGVNGGKASANEIYDTLSDGIHVTANIDSRITTPSANILVEDNVAKNTGDDSFSSVGTLQGGVTPVTIQGTQFVNNRASDGCTSGVTVEGTIGATVSSNTVTRSGLSGIRIASDMGWKSPATSSVVVSGNILDSVRTRCDEFHPALLVGSDYQAVSGISVSGNTIRNPHTPWGIGFIPNPPGTVSNVSATGNTFVVGFNQPSCGGSSTTLTGAECVKVLPPTSSATVSGNTYNGAACP